jgi:hypothetical protein
MPLLLPEMVDAGTAKDVDTAMRKDLRAAAKTLHGKDLWFIAAADVVLKDKKKVSLFVVSPKEAVAKAWQLKLKGKKPRVLALGTCTLETQDGKYVQVALEKISGDRNATLKTVKLAFKLDTAVRVADALAKDEDEDEDSEAEVDQATVKSAASALGIDAKTIASLIADADLNDEDMAEIQKLLANPKRLEAEALKMFDDLAGA